jgi:hypothetical protein
VDGKVRQLHLLNFSSSFLVSDIHDSTLAIRNSRYKLLQAYNGYSDWYSYADTNQTSDMSACSINMDDGDFTFYLFDLLNDPYETTNLFHRTGYADIKVGRHTLYSLFINRIKFTIYLLDILV